MPHLPRRLKAFTILELLVVLVVSALLFSMAYAALRMVLRQQQLIVQKSAALGSISTWQSILAADFKAGTAVEVSQDQVRCERTDGPVFYTYSYADSALVRAQGDVVDTFRVPIRECRYFWQGQPRTSGRIDEIALLSVFARDTFYLQAALPYAAEQLLPALSITP